MIVMSNNIWSRDDNAPAWEAKGEDCSADARVVGLTAVYQSILPDVLGLQEVTRYMEPLLFSRMRRVALPDGGQARYEIVTGGATPILYRDDTFCLLESGHRIYPESFPPYEGSFNDWASKGYTYAVLEDRATGKKLAVFTTHLWWKTSDPNKGGAYQAGSAEARAFQIRMAAAVADELIARYACPVILMGDLNSSLGSKCLDAAQAAGFRETHDLATGERYEGSGYHYCYADGWRHDPEGTYDRAIDHILIKNPGTTEVHRFLRYVGEDFDRLSDHFPVYVDLSLA